MPLIPPDVMPLIPPDEISYSALSSLDPLGRLFRWKGKIYRGIHPESVELVRNLFASGCLEELAKRGLFPQSRLTDFSLEGFGLVVEHEEIPFVVYPYEWSFRMLQEAAVATLEAAEIAARFGWEFSDLHPYNVLFKSGRPVYVDLGSFQPLHPGRKKGQSSDYHKFVKTFWRPLSLWAAGDSFLAQSILSSNESHLPDLSWWLYRHSALRAISPRFSARWARRFDRWSRNGAKLLDRVKLLSRLPASLASRLPVELLTRNPELLRKKISRLKPPLPSSWDNYHAEVFKQGKPVSNPCFDRILEIIRSFHCESVIELAGNEGAFTLLLAAHTEAKKLVCTDYSSSPIDRFHHHCRNQAAELEGKQLQGAVLNFMVPAGAIGAPTAPDRLRSDAVIALGVLHHLILTQRFHPREILAKIASYSREYVLVEFMPLGMWTAKKSKPSPSWYSQDWFHQIFAETFDLISVEELEKNRTLFVGRLKAPAAAKQLEAPAAYFDTRKQAA